MEQLIAYLPKAHVIIALLLVAIFLLRGLFMIASSASVNSKLMLGSTSMLTMLLFISGITLAIISKISLADGWAMTKILGLLVYVGIGVIALKQGLPKITAIILWLMGLGIFSYTFMVAKHMLPALY